MISKNQIKYVRSLEQKKIRDRERVFVAEGPKIVTDIMALCKPTMLYATNNWMDTHKNNDFRNKCTIVTDDELRKISFLKHPQQVLAVFPIPETEFETDICKHELCIALDAVQDPGNLGTIIRIADWFGISTIFCGDGTADAFNPKVIQATMGSIARVRIIYTNLYDLLESIPCDTPTYAMSLDGDDIYTQQLSDRGIIIMGNEGKGISPEIMQKVNNKILIPNYSRIKGIDSLNVAIATALACAEFRRRI